MTIGKKIRFRARIVTLSIVCVISSISCNGDRSFVDPGSNEGGKARGSVVAKSFDSGQLSPFGFGASQALTIPLAPPAAGDVTFTFRARADLSLADEKVSIYLNDVFQQDIFAGVDQDCPTVPNVATIVMSAADFNARVSQCGELRILMSPSASVNAYQCQGPASYIRVTVTYDAEGPDCNENDTTDVCDLLTGVSLDCNENGVPDSCDIMDDASADTNENHIPDECEMAVFSVLPDSGPKEGGTIVTLDGRGFVDGLSVRFGGFAATDVQVINSVLLTAVTPAHDPGDVDIVLEHDQVGILTVTLPDAFEYTGPAALSVSSILPASGPTEGGTIVTMAGQGFVEGLSVRFGGIAASDVQVVNSALLTAVSPVHDSGQVDIVIEGEQGSIVSFTLQNAFEYAELPVDDGTDTDGDGLTDVQELIGWEVWYDGFALGLGTDTFGNVIRRQSTSDPNDTDTDDDGLTDLEELLAKSDARDADFDDDTLLDGDEVHRWLTSPATIDTDADSRGPDRQLNLAPNPALFDAQELALDANGNASARATSPRLADTDGDGATDFEELQHPFRSALVADVPKLKVDFVGELHIVLDITLEDGTSVTDGTETGLVESESSTEASTDESTYEKSLEFTEEASLMISGDVGIPVGAGFEATVGFSATQGFTEGSSTSWSEESTEETQNSFLEIQEATRDQTRSVNGGVITTGIKVINQGDTAFTLENLVLSALLIDPTARDGFKPLATLRPPVDQLTLAAQDETGVLVFDTETGAVGAELLLELMSDPSALLLDVAAFDLLDAEGRSFAFLNDVTNARTATVTIDLGIDLPIETYRVATEVKRNADGSAAGITIGQILTEILNIPFETTTRTGSNNPAFPNGVKVLTKVRNRETELSEGLEVDRFWVVFGTSPGSSDASVDFQEIVLHANETLSLVYTEDKDHDGVFKREEFMYLTSDELVDTDSDTLGDFFEIRTGWDVLVQGQSLKHVFPDPTRMNVDQDGLNDLQEYNGGVNSTDPKSPDTDGDGLLDGMDNCPLEVVNPGPDIMLTQSADDSGSIVNLTGRVFESFVEGTARCDVDQIESIVIDWSDGYVENLVFPQPDTDVPVNLSHIYATQEVDTIHVVATDIRGAMSTVDFNVSISFPTRNQMAYYPFNNDRLDYTCNDRNGSQLGDTANDTTTANRFTSADRAYCFHQNGVIDGHTSAGVSIPHMPVPGTSHGFTVAAWIIPHGASEDGIIVGQRDFTALFADDSGGNVGFTVRKPDSTYVTITDNAYTPPSETAGDDTTCLQSAPAADWTFYAGVVRYDAATMDTTIRLYRGKNADLLDANTMNNVVVEITPAVVLDNIQIINPSASQIWQVVGESLTFGGVPNNIDDPLRGRVDDVRIYDDGLTVIEINALFNEGNNSSAMNINGPCPP